jgi:hypothetical protein
MFEAMSQVSKLAAQSVAAGRLLWDVRFLKSSQKEGNPMKKEAFDRQQQGQNTASPDQVQSPNERPQSPQPVFEPEQAQSEITKEEIARRAHSIYEQRGGFPGAELDDWLQAERELREENGKGGAQAA